MPSSSTSTWVTVTVFAACASTPATQPSRPPAEFCARLVAGDLEAAGQSAHGALVAAEADDLADASEPLAAWLRSQPCVTSVEVPSVVVETEPATRELVVRLMPDAEGAVRTCVADLRLAPGGQVAIHPASDVSNNPDRRCTARP